MQNIFSISICVGQICRSVTCNIAMNFILNCNMELFSCNICIICNSQWKHLPWTSHGQNQLICVFQFHSECVVYVSKYLCILQYSINLYLICHYTMNFNGAYESNDCCAFYFAITQITCIII